MLYFIKVRTKHQKEALQRKRNLRKKTHFFLYCFIAVQFSSYFVSHQYLVLGVHITV